MRSPARRPLAPISCRFRSQSNDCVPKIASFNWFKDNLWTLLTTRINYANFLVNHTCISQKLITLNFRYCCPSPCDRLRSYHLVHFQTFQNDTPFMVSSNCRVFITVSIVTCRPFKRVKIKINSFEKYDVTRTLLRLLRNFLWTRHASGNSLVC